MAKETFKTGDIVVLSYVRSPKMTVIDVDDTNNTVTVGWFDRHDDYHTATHPVNALELDRHTMQCKLMLKAMDDQAVNATL